MIKKENLLLLASIVWLIAGFNVLNIGIETYQGFTQPINMLASIIIGIIFWFMVFYKLTVKHTKRIMNYTEEKQLFIHFFDVKSFIIMAVMISGGVVIRLFHVLPNRFIAVFYSGLGAALFLAGVLFSFNYFRIIKKVNRKR